MFKSALGTSQKFASALPGSRSLNLVSIFPAQADALLARVRVFLYGSSLIQQHG
jgi:hypothetical protein